MNFIRLFIAGLCVCFAAEANSKLELLQSCLEAMAVHSREVVDLGKFSQNDSGQVFVNFISKNQDADFIAFQTAVTARKLNLENELSSKSDDGHLHFLIQGKLSEISDLLRDYTSQNSIQLQSALRISNVAKRFMPREIENVLNFFAKPNEVSRPEKIYKPAKELSSLKTFLRQGDRYIRASFDYARPTVRFKMSEELPYVVGMDFEFLSRASFVDVLKTFAAAYGMKVSQLSMVDIERIEKIRQTVQPGFSKSEPLDKNHFIVGDAKDFQNWHKVEGLLFDAKVALVKDPFALLGPRNTDRLRKPYVIFPPAERKAPVRKHS